jgi:hypothetical protein
MGQMRRKVELSVFVLLAMALILTACSASDGQSGGESSTQTPSAAIPVPGVKIPPTPVKIVAVDAAAPRPPEAPERGDAAADAD